MVDDEGAIAGKNDWDGIFIVVKPETLVQAKGCTKKRFSKLRPPTGMTFRVLSVPLQRMEVNADKNIFDKKIVAG